MRILFRSVVSFTTSVVCISRRKTCTFCYKMLTWRYSVSHFKCHSLRRVLFPARCLLQIWNLLNPRYTGGAGPPPFVRRSFKRTTWADDILFVDYSNLRVQTLGTFIFTTSQTSLLRASEQRVRSFLTRHHHGCLLQISAHICSVITKQTQRPHIPRTVRKVVFP